jgi:hypothetical protein
VSGDGAACEAARAVAFVLAGTNDPTRRVTLGLLESRASRGDAIADGRDVEQVWNDLRRLRDPTPPLRRLKRDAGPRASLPVEDARRVPIDRVLIHLGFDLQRTGRQLRTTCPFHDDAHPSLTVNVDRNAWYCWPCGRGGDALRFVMDYQQVSFAEAVREVATW